MTRRPLLALLLCLAGRASAQAPDTDVFLAPITRIGDSIIVGAAVNITRRAGYDNQPSFTADSRSVLYTAQGDGQADVWRYEIATRRTRRLTRTRESEYSPTRIPGQRRFSVVRVERDSTQRLWSFAMDGTDPRLLLPSLKPVGYYAWVSDNRLAAYVLGTGGAPGMAGAPGTLHLLDRSGARDTIIAQDVGRALQPLPPGANALFTFTRRVDGSLRIFVLSGRTVPVKHTRRVVRVNPGGVVTTTEVVDSIGRALEPPYEFVAAPSDNEHHAWMPDVMLITASGSVLQRWSAELGAGSRWLPVADLRPNGVKNVSRLAVSPDGAWLAFVAEPDRP